MELGPTSYVILGLLGLGPHSGYDIKQLADMSTRHFWATSYGQIYPELRRMTQAGLIKPEDASKGTRQRTIYHLTAKGRQTLHAWVADGTVQPVEIRDEMLLKLFFATRCRARRRSSTSARCASATRKSQTRCASTSRWYRRSRIA